MNYTIQAAATGDAAAMSLRFQVAFVERSGQVLGASVMPETLGQAQDLACRMAGDGEFTAALKCADAWWSFRAD
jgi:hypothetical protein